MYSFKMKAGDLISKGREKESQAPMDRTSTIPKESMLGQAPTCMKPDPAYGCVDWFAYAAADAGSVAVTSPVRPMGAGPR